MPWWLGVTLAVIAYGGLHFYVALGRQAKDTLTLPPRIEPYLGASKPACPRCSLPMLERVAQQGSKAGKSFWGCPAFPDCRGTLPIG